MHDRRSDERWAAARVGVAHLTEKAPWTLWERWRWDDAPSFAGGLMPISAKVLGALQPHAAFLEWRDAWNQYAAARPWRRVAEGEGGLVVLTYASKDGRVVESAIERTLCPTAAARRVPCPVLNLAGGAPGERAPPYTLHTTKVLALRDYLRAAAAAGRANRTVVFTDGTDAVWGGCQPDGGAEADLLAGVRERLNTLFALSGARVIFSGELGTLGSWGLLNASPQLHGRGIELPAEWQRRAPPWARRLCAPDAAEGEAARADGPAGGAPRTPAPFPAYLNSGVFAGSVAALLPVVERVAAEMQAGMWRARSVGPGAKYLPYLLNDQLGFSWYWAGHTADVAVDHCSLLALSTFFDAKGGQRDPLRTTRVALDGRIRHTDRATGVPRDICFLHLNGASREKRALVIGQVAQRLGGRTAANVTASRGALTTRAY